MEAIEATQVEELAKLRDEHGKLEGELMGRHERLETLEKNNVILVSKVVTLEARARAANERLKEMEFTRDADIG